MKNILPLFIAALLLCACTQVEEKNVVLNDSPDHEKLVQEYFGYFNQHNWAKMAEMYAVTAEFKDPSLGQGIVKQSREEIIKKYTELNAIFPDIQDKVSQIYKSGDKHIVVEFISTGTAPDSSKFELPICTIFEFENGKIIKDFTYYDNSGGSEPEPEK